MLGAQVVQLSEHKIKHNLSHRRWSDTHLTRGTHVYVRDCVSCYVRIVVHLTFLFRFS